MNLAKDFEVEVCTFPHIGPHGLAAHGDELFACDYGDDCLQVFSFTGEHRRTVHGDFWRPEVICFTNDRLYLIEDAIGPEEMRGDDEATKAAKRMAGRRVLVLTPKGVTLQVLHCRANEHVRHIVQFEDVLVVAMIVPNEDGTDFDNGLRLARLAGI